MTKEVIEELKEKKIAKESQGALIIEFPKNEFPLVILQKSDGTTTYFSRDLATIKYRLKRWNPDLIIYEVGADQKLHFQQLFKTVEILGWAKKTKFVHVAHGLYRTKTGKFSTRRGETVHLEDVLKEAIERAKEIIEKSETSRGLTEREKEKISKIVGIGAVKYNDLSQHPSKDIIFDWEKVLNLKGNSAPYLQYTFVRCQSVLRKAKKLQIANCKLQIEKLKKEEIDILREIYKFPELVQEAAEKFSPNLICNFVFDLAKKYNLFYDLYPILKAEDEETKNFRLILTKAVAQIIKNSLSLFGIGVPKKM
jgi:arginyl-tRNA synthetase